MKAARIIFTGGVLAAVIAGAQQDGTTALHAAVYEDRLEAADALLDLSALLAVNVGLLALHLVHRVRERRAGALHPRRGRHRHRADPGRGWLLPGPAGLPEGPARDL